MFRNTNLPYRDLTVVGKGKNVTGRAMTFGPSSGRGLYFLLNLHFVLYRHSSIDDSDALSTLPDSIISTLANRTFEPFRFGFRDSGKVRVWGSVAGSDPVRSIPSVPGSFRSVSFHVRPMFDRFMLTAEPEPDRPNGIGRDGSNRIVSIGIC